MTKFKTKPIHFALWFNDDYTEFVPACNQNKYFNGNNFSDIRDFDLITCKKCYTIISDDNLVEKAFDKWSKKWI